MFDRVPMGFSTYWRKTKWSKTPARVRCSASSPRGKVMERCKIAHQPAVAAALVLLAGVLSAQQGPADLAGAARRNPGPAGAMGIDPFPLPGEPQVFDTAEHQKIRVVVVAKGFAHPWSLALLPDGSMLVTEREGALRIVS